MIKHITSRNLGAPFPGIHPGFYVSTVPCILFLLLLIGFGFPVQAQETAQPQTPTLDPSPCENRDGEGPRMILIQAGSFRMGSPAGEPGRSSNEGPQHPVTVMRPFALSRCEICVAQYRRFVDETGYLTDAERGQGCYALNEAGDNYESRPDRNWREPGFTQTEEHPVVCVSWHDAIALEQVAKACILLCSQIRAGYTDEGPGGSC